MRPDLNFLKEDDYKFFYLRRCVDRRMQEVTENGVNIQKRQADPISIEDEEKLWVSEAFDMSSSDGLLAAVYYYNCKVFGLRSRDEHRSLSLDQFVFGEDSNGKFIIFNGKTSKSNKGGLRHRKISEKKIKHYDTSSEKSTYKILEFYLKRLRACRIVNGDFYRRPLKALLKEPRYGVTPVGIHGISKLLPNAAKKANISAKYVTGHSGKVTCATSLYRKGVDEQLIRERTGHRSNAIREYKRTSSEQQKMISEYLDFPSNQPTSSKSVLLSKFRVNYFNETSFDLNVKFDC